MQTIRQLGALRAAVAEARQRGAVALVPTMGALHAGHIALVDEARRRAGTVVASIFVNPKQFAAGEDLDRYPRRERADAKMLADAGCAILWAPDADAVYPAGFSTGISVAGITGGYEGAVRPGHFDGVATVVAKLLNAVSPDIALFGEKDWQQLQVVRRMVADLDLGVEIVGVPTLRDADGLALSSRNAFLDADERRAARVLPRTLGEAAAAIARGEGADAVLGRAREALAAAGFAVDYVALVDGATMTPLETAAPGARLVAAARMGATRLIDNMALPPA